jgi:hypothetical protein
VELCEASAAADPGEASAEVAQLAFPAGLLSAGPRCWPSLVHPELPVSPATVMVGPFPRLNASRSSTISIRTRSRRDDGRNRPPRPATSTPTARVRPAFGFRTARSRRGSRRARGRPPRPPYLRRVNLLSLSDANSPNLRPSARCVLIERRRRPAPLLRSCVAFISSVVTNTSARLERSATRR